MKLINQKRLMELSSNGSNIIFGNKSTVNGYFLDEIRVGLTISAIMELPNEIDFNRYSEISLTDHDRTNCVIKKGSFYLASTEEKFSLPSNVIGIINTRSKFARIGLETVSSSWFVTPNFGTDNPTPLILEIKSFTDIYNMNFSSPVSYMMLFEITEKINSAETKNYAERFPFSLWQKK